MSYTNQELGHPPDLICDGCNQWVYEHVSTTDQMSFCQWCVVKCSCGEEYDPIEWDQLEFVGIQKDIEGFPDMELRNCVCRSTISREVEE